MRIGFLFSMASRIMLVVSHGAQGIGIPFDPIPITKVATQRLPRQPLVDVPAEFGTSSSPRLPALLGGHAMSI